MYASEAKKFKFLVHLDRFSNGELSQLLTLLVSFDFNLKYSLDRQKCHIRLHLYILCLIIDIFSLWFETAATRKS